MPCGQAVERTPGTPGTPGTVFAFSHSDTQRRRRADDVRCMPRYRRQVEPGSVQHLISRFVDHRFQFDEASAREQYLARAPAALRRSDWRPLAFALMSSHVHWAMRAGARPSASFVKPLHVSFASWVNRSGGLGPVFADRHRTITCQGATAAALLAYVHNNPVRAGLVRDPAESLWTSHRAYIGLEPAPPWLDVAQGLSLCGFDPTPDGRARFHDFVCERSAEPRSVALSGGDLAQRRATARATTGSPIELVSPTVREIGGERSVETAIVFPYQCPQRQPWRGSPLEIIDVVASVAGVASEALRSRSRVRAVTSARKLALLLWCNELTRSSLEMAMALGISASAACGLVARANTQAHEDAMRLGQRLRAASPRAPGF